MDKRVQWSNLPRDLINVVADRSSNFDILRISSVCKEWRSAVTIKKRLRGRFKRSLVGPSNRKKESDLLPNTYYRVTQATSSYSCHKKGWLIKTRQVSESSKINLLSPFSNELIIRPDKTLDLFKFGVSEIRQTYNVQFLNKQTQNLRDACRAVFVDNHVFVVDTNKQIWCCLRVEGSSSWKRVHNKGVGEFSDVILHKGQVYGLDLKGAIWRIDNSLNDLKISQYGPSAGAEYIESYECKDKRFLEYCGDLCVVHRLCKKFCVKQIYIEKTTGFKVYKMDKELAEWVEISSLEDKALIVATDSCFTVVASEYYGCLESAIYFSDDDDGYTFRKRVKKSEGVKVLKLDNSSCFEMFSSPFL